MKLTELKDLMKENNIKGTSFLNKSEIINKLIDCKVLSEDNNTKPEKVKNKTCIRNNPRQVEITDLETNTVTVYPSMYKAARALNQSVGVIAVYEGRTWRKRYKIKILPKKSDFNYQENSIL